MVYNTKLQFYKGIGLRLLVRNNYSEKKAKLFSIGGTKYTLWIPNRHLKSDGTLKEGQALNYLLEKSKESLRLAGIDLSETLYVTGTSLAKVGTLGLSCALCGSRLRIGDTAVFELIEGVYNKVACLHCTGGRCPEALDEDLVYHEALHDVYSNYDYTKPGDSDF